MNEQLDERPLPAYIEPAVSAQVTLDGPALCVSMPEKADVWLPLRRLSRLVVSEKVQIETAAILACARRGVTIVMHDQDDGVLARMIGCGDDLTGLHQRLMDLTVLPDWRERYQNWLDAQSRRIAMTVTRRTRAPQRLAYRPRLLAEWLQSQAVERVGANIAEQTHRLYLRHGMVWMQHSLVRLGVDATQRLWREGEPDLAGDLGRLLALRMEPARLGWLEAMGRGGVKRPLRDKAVVRRLERLRPRLERLDLDLVNRLYVWLSETEGLNRR